MNGTWRRRAAVAGYLFILAVSFASLAKAAKDELVIGITQFPSTFHPTIDPDDGEFWIRTGVWSE